MPPVSSPSYTPFMLKRYPRDALVVTGVLTGFLGAVCCSLQESVYFQQSILASVIGVLPVFWITWWFVPVFAQKLGARGLGGKDLNKIPIKDKPTQIIPEALGIVPAFVYVLFGIVCYFLVVAPIPHTLESRSSNYAALEFLSALFGVLLITFLGFVDDVVELRWRYKMILPLFAAVPLLCVYRGPTTVIVPGALWRPIARWLPEEWTAPEGSALLLQLGPLYYVYMATLTIFCSNAINIYAGLNGLEVGQAIIMAAGILIHDTIEIFTNGPDHPGAAHHSLTFILNVLFLCCATGVFMFNKYPSQVFIGDTFTYFAGVHFAVVGILGQFAKTVLLFFIPQIVNFLISTPQLFGLIPCPRHRVPRINPQTGNLEASPNLTVMNLTLKIFGPMSERHLVNFLLCVQICTVGIALLIRYSPLYTSLFL